MITLFESDEKDFTTQGLGGLPDAITPKVTEKRNSTFEFEMVYPVNGARFSEIKTQRIIKCKANPYDAENEFRIWKIGKPINGKVEVFARQLSYDADGIPVGPFTANSCSAALTALKTNAVVDCPFDFWTDKDVAAKMVNIKPTALRSLLGGQSGSILDSYGKGEYEFSGYSIKLHLNRGADRGVVLRYGKNITDIRQEENCANMATGVCGYWYKEDSALVSQLVKIKGNFPYENVLTVDFSNEWQDQPTEAQVKARVQKYIEDNNLTKPKISINVSFIDTPPTPELAALSTVRLCDTISVKFEKLGIDATAKVVSTVYDVLNDRYTSIEVGDAKTTLASTLAETDAKAKEATTPSALENAIAHASKLIQGVLGGHVIIWNNSTKLPQNPNEILIMDTEDIATAQNVWRFNLGGLGHSSTGYNGKYDLAMTMDGKINASMILTGILQGIQVILGDKPTIKGSDGNYHYPVELNSDGTAYFAGELHIGPYDENRLVYAFNVTSEGAATCTNLTVVNGHIVGSDYNSLAWHSGGDTASRMYLDSAALNFYSGEYQQNKDDGSYYGDNPTGQLKSDVNGVHLNAESGKMAALSSNGKDLLYVKDGTIYGTAPMNFEEQTITAKTFSGDLTGNADTATNADHAGDLEYNGSYYGAGDFARPGNISENSQEIYHIGGTDATGNYQVYKLTFSWNSDGCLNSVYDELQNGHVKKAD